MDFLRKTRLWQRFVLLGVIASIMCLVPLVNLVMIKQAELGVAKAELAGLDPLMATMELQKLLQQHRDAAEAASVAAGDGPPAPAETGRQAGEVDKALAALKSRLVDQGYALSAKSLEAVAQAWGPLRDQTRSGELKGEPLLTAHREIIANTSVVMDHVADESTLSLDPVAESYYLMTALIDHAPRLAEALERLRIRVRLMDSAGHEKSDYDRQVVTVLIERATYLEGRRAAQVTKAITLRPELKAGLATTLEDHARSFTAATTTRVLDGRETSDDLAAIGNAAVRDEYRSIEEIANVLRQVLGERLDAIQQQTLELILTVLGLGLGAILLGFAITRSVTRPLDRAVAAAAAVGEGDLDHAIVDDGHDEAGELLKRLQGMQEKLRQRRSDDEAWRLEDEKRLAEVQAASERDRLVAAQVGEAVRKAALNDLTWRIDLADKDGLHAELCKGVNDILDAMAQVVAQVKEATETINTASREIASGNSDLSARTEEQASSLQETAASMEQLNSAVRQNSDAARQASQLAVGAVEVAGRGGAVMSEVVQTMSGISEASGKIADIISVIDGIAFQTNILALNAAVEAARAGEQGRGFAVVASEVRALAQRSAAAAKEIKVLISDSSDKVAGGSRLVDQAGATMREIEASVRHVTELMSEIATASAEQSAGIQQVSEAVSQMDNMTQQNAALVEEAAAAAESLQGQAEGLYQTVSRFRIDDSGGRAAARPMAASASPKAPALRASSAGQQVAAAVGSSARAPGSMSASPADADWEEF